VRRLPRERQAQADLRKQCSDAADLKRIYKVLHRTGRRRLTSSASDSTKQQR
jgi:hypothetical protein